MLVNNLKPEKPKVLEEEVSAGAYFRSEKSDLCDVLIVQGSRGYYIVNANCFVSITQAPLKGSEIAIWLNDRHYYSVNAEIVAPRG